MNVLDKYVGTKQLLRRSFVQILAQKEYGQVTVLDIVVKSGVTPEAFYQVYGSVDALLAELVADLASGLAVLMRKAYEGGLDELLHKIMHDFPPVFLEYFRFGRANSEVLAILCSRRCGLDFPGLFMKALEGFKRRSIEICLEWNGHGDPKVLQMVYGQALQDFINSLLNWVCTGMEMDEMRMAEHHSRIWVSYMMLLKDTAPDSIYQRLIRKMGEAGIQENIIA